MSDDNIDNPPDTNQSDAPENDELTYEEVQEMLNSEKKDVEDTEKFIEKHGNEKQKRKVNKLTPEEAKLLKKQIDEGMLKSASYNIALTAYAGTAFVETKYPHLKGLPLKFHKHSEEMKTAIEQLLLHYTKGDIIGIFSNPWTPLGMISLSILLETLEENGIFTLGQKISETKNETSDSNE